MIIPPPLTLPAAQMAALQAAYATPPRAYHHFGHVGEVLQHWAEVAVGPGWTQPVETYLAVLYHDAVYQPGRRDNEVRSADLAREHIARWLADAGIDAARVAQLIEYTSRHGQWSPDDFNNDPAPDDARHFLDCDMAILGAAPETFDAYHRAIAEEYRGKLPAWLFRRNRRRFLKALLQRERIYLSEFFHQRLEARTRDNLRRALEASNGRA